MSKLQIYVLSAAGLLLIILLFGFNAKPKKQSGIDKARALRAEQTDINSLLTAARESLEANESTTVLLMEQALKGVSEDSLKIEKLEQLSRKWFDLGHPEISGHYAERIAELTENDEAWAIAGTTYAIGRQRAEVEKVKAYCSGRAVKAFENAISINPDEISHQINLALCYTDDPPKDNPMKGILMLVDLNKKNPDSVPVLYQLGRLAIRTGQFAKAVERLEQAAAVEPQNARVICLLTDAYQGLGNESKMEENKQKCQALAGNK